MRAALLDNGQIRTATVDDPVPQAGEVLVKSLACGICGSDLHAARHTEEFVATSLEAGGAFKLTTTNPVVLGHEFCAEIVDYGPDTERKLGIGQNVCSVPMLTRAEPLAVGYSEETPGGFAEYFLLSESLLRPVPSGTPAEAAALTEPMAVGLHAVNKAHLRASDTALVIGCGPVGLAVITALKAQGIRATIASDFSAGRRRFAEQQGADLVVDPTQADPFKLPDITIARRLVVFECVGVPGMLDKLFLSAPQNADIVVVGVCLQTDHIRPLIAINKELSLTFVLGYTMDEFDQSLASIADGKFPVEAMISDRTPLDGVQAAFDALANPETHAKILVTP